MRRAFASSARIGIGAAFLALACSSQSTNPVGPGGTPDGGNEADAPGCVNMQGHWTVNTCGYSGCTIVQTGCDFQGTCTWLGFAANVSGTINGNTLEMSGAGSCTLDVEGNLFSGTCTSEGGTCNVTGHR